MVVPVGVVVPASMKGSSRRNCKLQRVGRLDLERASMKGSSRRNCKGAPSVVLPQWRASMKGSSRRNCKGVRGDSGRILGVPQ